MPTLKHSKLLIARTSTPLRSLLLVHRQMKLRLVQAMLHYGRNIACLLGDNTRLLGNNKKKGSFGFIETALRFRDSNDKYS